MKELKLFLLTQGLLTLIASLVALEMGDLLTAASVAAGGMLVLINVALTAYLVMQMIRKKQIALSVTIILFKYTILGAIVFSLLSAAWVQKGWFVIGLGSLVVSAPLYAFYISTRKEEEEDVI
jgi:hypothetical protein